VRTVTAAGVAWPGSGPQNIPPLRARDAGAFPFPLEFSMNRSLRHTLLAAATVAVFGVSGVAFAKDKLESDRDKVSYMVGMQIGNSLQQIKGEVDLPVLFQAIETTLKAGTPLLTAEEAQTVQKSFAERLQAQHAAEQAAAAKKNKEEGDAFLASNKGKKGVTTTASGLQYQAASTPCGCLRSWPMATAARPARSAPTPPSSSKSSCWKSSRNKLRAQA